MTRSLSLLILSALFLGGCDTIDLYERTAALKGHEWRSNVKPTFRFDIKDTTAPYQLYVLFRHSAEYGFNNVWVSLATTFPDGKTARVQYELPLATNEKGWLGTGMSDVFEHRIALTPVGKEFYFRQAGTYTFTLEHIMRENPLLGVHNVGLRVEKKRGG
ncbi:gliding motility lipoprotein GldH [Flaviaesturariibacter amylovorans]|uniref:Gliding motility lipoprotein GldH n=1 Tax=Flaviaesturariibacter amylovorans TaxID=1084520 RepID=A0ABP8HUY3_9BACT